MAKVDVTFKNDLKNELNALKPKTEEQDFWNNQEESNKKSLEISELKNKNRRKKV